MDVRLAAEAFLANKRIAVTGVSRRPEGHGGNVVHRRLRERGYELFAVNPNPDTVEGDPCFTDLTACGHARYLAGSGLEGVPGSSRRPVARHGCRLERPNTRDDCP